MIDGLRKDLRENDVRVKLSHEITEILPAMLRSRLGITGFALE